MTAPAPAHPVSVLNVSDLPVARSWVHQGHALYLVQDIEYSRDPAALWVTYYRPRPLASLPLSPAAREREIQILATGKGWEEVARLAEEAIDAGAAETPPDLEQTRLKAESLDREAGVAGFIAPEDLPKLDVVPFRYDPSRPPLPPDGLQIGRDDAGTWRTYQERYPGSTLTAGHASNVEAYWACHALRDLAAWAITVDVRVDGSENESAPCQIAREDLALRVDGVSQRFARWRQGPQFDSEPDAVREIRGVPDLHLSRRGRGLWAVVRNCDGWPLTDQLIASEVEARRAAKQLNELADWSSAPPPYVLVRLPALWADIAAIEADACRWHERAENSRQLAANIRRKVAEAERTARRR